MSRLIHTSTTGMHLGCRQPLLMLAVCLLSCPTLFSQNYWTSCPSPTTSTLNTVFFLDSVTGWVAGENGTILHTTDGGTTWMSQPSGVSSAFVGIHMISPLRGWAVGLELFSDTGSSFGSYLLSTVDGGSTWSSKLFRDQYFYTVWFNDSAKGWLGGEGGMFLQTTDGGESWTGVPVDTGVVFSLPIRTIRFYSSSYGYAVGGFREFTGIVWRTTNGGALWRQTAVGDELFDLHFVDSLSIFAAGGGLDDGAGAARTTNGGATWTFAYIGFFGQARAVDFRVPGEAWMPLGFTGSFLCTTDNGQIWTQYYAPDSTPVFDVAFTDANTGYMVGKDGMILKYVIPTTNVSVEVGWNLLSVPAARPNLLKDSVFTGSTSRAFVYAGSYLAVDTLAYGQGMWLKFDGPREFVFRGGLRFQDTVDVDPRWNMIGGISLPVPVDSIIQIPDGIVTSQYFGFENGYRASDTLFPGKGYWVKTNGPGKLVLQKNE